MTLKSCELPESAGPLDHFVLLSQSAKWISCKGKVLAQSEAGSQAGCAKGIWQDRGHCGWGWFYGGHCLGQTPWQRACQLATPN